MTTPRSTEIGPPPLHAPGAARIVIAAAPTLDALSAVVGLEVDAALSSSVSRLLIGSTSAAPRDEAARAARWVSRLAARRSIAAAIAADVTWPSSSSAPGAADIVASLRRLPRSLTSSAEPPPGATVGVSRLDLSSTVEAVDQQPYAVAIWLALEPRSLRLRRRLGADPAVEIVRAAMRAAPVCTVLVGREPGMALTVVGSDLIACEVVGRALRAAAQPVGDLGLSPWEGSVVQRAGELGAGVTHPDQIRVEPVWLGDPADRRHDRLHALVETAAARAGIRG